MLAPLKFVWSATRGYRLAPWKSPFLRWRIETYSGKPAELLGVKDVLAFVWTSRWELLEFLGWTREIQSEARRRA